MKKLKTILKIYGILAIVTWLITSYLLLELNPFNYNADNRGAFIFANLVAFMISIIIDAFKDDLQ